MLVSEIKSNKVTSPLLNFRNSQRRDHKLPRREGRLVPQTDARPNVSEVKNGGNDLPINKSGNFLADHHVIEPVHTTVFEFVDWNPIYNQECPSQMDIVSM